MRINGVNSFVQFVANEASMLIQKTTLSCRDPIQSQQASMEFFYVQLTFDFV